MIIQMVHNEKAPLNRHNQYTMCLNHHLQTCQWRVLVEIFAASCLKNSQETKERWGDKLPFMPCKSSRQGWGLKSKVTLSSGCKYRDGRQTNGSSLYLGLVFLFYCWTVSPLTMSCAKTQFKAQIIGILEVIDSFYWPKMHSWKGRQNPKDQQFFLRMSSLSFKALCKGLSDAVLTDFAVI